MNLSRFSRIPATCGVFRIKTTFEFLHSLGKIQNHMLPKKIAFVDIETSGCRYSDRIIEIGILRVEDGKVVKTLNTLLNPDCFIPQEIVDLTGINPKDLETAPSFYELKNEIFEILKDCLFVAHNVRFDYSFIKNEFKRWDISFSPKQLCTVKLSRMLYPEFRHHNLDSIIERFNFQCKNRHRAFNDAEILWKFYQSILDKYSEEDLLQVINKLLKKPSVPINLSIEILESLPEKPGVYIFYAKAGMPLYVGKSINIKNRVLSHFASDHLSNTEMKIAEQIENIKIIETPGELGALFTESQLIKKLQPLYNRKLRNSYKMIALIQTQDENDYLTVQAISLDQIQALDFDKILAIVKSKKAYQNLLISLVSEYQLCEKVLGIEKSKKECFNHRLGKCLGACQKKEIPPKYNLRFIEAFKKTKLRTWPFDKPIVIKESDGEKEEGFIIDKWCYMGNIKNTGEDHTIQKEYNFDVDTYRIINSFLKSNKNTKKIQYLT